MFCITHSLFGDSSRISNRAVKEVASQSYTKHARAAILNNSEEKKRKRIARQDRLKQRFETRKKNHVLRQQKLQALYKHTGAHRTSADYQEELRRLSRTKHAHHHLEKNKTVQKQTFIAQKEDTAQAKKDMHAAARNALRKKKSDTL